MDEPIDFTVVANKYVTDAEYRAVMRAIFRMKPQYKVEGENYVFRDGSIINCNDIDDETLDEVNLDQTRYDECFHYIWEMTKNNKQMLSLYEWSAGKFISSDYELGIAGLLSFDKLPLFYAILCKIAKGCVVTNEMIDAIMTEGTTILRPSVCSPQPQVLFDDNDNDSSTGSF